MTISWNSCSSHYWKHVETPALRGCCYFILCLCFENWTLFRFGNCNYFGKFISPIPLNFEIKQLFPFKKYLKLFNLCQFWKWTNKGNFDWYNNNFSSQNLHILSSWSSFNKLLLQDLCNYVNVEVEFVEFFKIKVKMTKICKHRRLNLLLYQSKLCSIDGRY